MKEGAMTADIEPSPAAMSRSQLASEASQLGIEHIEHLHVEELAEVIAETRQQPTEADG